MSTHPAELIRRPDLGTLQAGAAADLVILDDAAEWTFDVRRSLSRSRNTPFGGSPMLGRVMCTVAGGSVVYKADRPLTDGLSASKAGT